MEDEGNSPPTCIRSAIIQTRFRHQPIFHMLRINAPRFSSSIAADIIISEAVPSQAIKVVDFKSVSSPEDLDAVHKEIESMDKQFRNNSVIVVGHESDFTKWCEWQASFKMQSTSFLFATSLSDVVDLIHGIYVAMTNREKLDKQSNFFQKMMADNESVSSTERIIRDTLSAVGLSDHEADKLVRNTPSLGMFVLSAANRQLPGLDNLEASNSLHELFTTDLLND